MPTFTKPLRGFIIVIAASAMLAGCNRARQNEASPPQQNQVNMQQQTKDHRIRVNQTNPPKRVIKNANQVASRLERLAVSIPRVRSANCVVFGNTAIVGIDVDSKLDRSRVGTIKYSVAEALRKDPYGANAIVTADIDLAQRLREIRQDIRRGRPISGFTNELSDIVGRIMPQLPKNVLPNSNPPARTEDKAQLHRKHL